ncbi:MAG: diacylglycerol kinase (ATP) [Candidatus Azotimanducaceae bacterium]
MGTNKVDSSHNLPTMHACGRLVCLTLLYCSSVDPSTLGRAPTSKNSHEFKTLTRTQNMTDKHEAPFNKSANTGLRHVVNATRFSAAGLRSAFDNESAFRQELFIFAFLLPTGAWLANSTALVPALVCACLLALCVELLNSGIEAAVDRFGLERDELAKQAKDYGSAAVLMALLIVGCIWLFITFQALGTLF